MTKHKKSTTASSNKFLCDSAHYLSDVICAPCHSYSSHTVLLPPQGRPAHASGPFHCYFLRLGCFPPRCPCGQLPYLLKFLPKSSPCTYLTTILNNEACLWHFQHPSPSVVSLPALPHPPEALGRQGCLSVLFTDVIQLPKQ